MFNLSQPAWAIQIIIWVNFGHYKLINTLHIDKDLEKNH